MVKKFLREDGWDEAILFDFASRHLAAAEILFQIQDPKVYIQSIYSAGYLCHLGIELVFKGCWLHISNYFENEHDLLKLRDKVSFLNLDDSQFEIYLSNLQMFNDLRYPQDLTNMHIIEEKDDNVNLSGEIGDHDWVGTIKLLHEIQIQMPENLKDVAKPIFKNFDNVLTENKFLKNGELLYRLVLDI